MRNAQRLRIAALSFILVHMSSRSAAAMVVVTEALRGEMLRLRRQLSQDGTPRQPGDDERDRLSQARLAALLELSDGSAVARLENGDTKAIRRELLEQIALTLEHGYDRGKLCKAAKVLPQAAEARLSVFRRAAGRELDFTVEAIRRIEAGLIAEEAYSAAGVSLSEGPVPHQVLASVAKINPRHVRRRPSDEVTPLILFTEPRLPARGREAVDVEIRWPGADTPSPAIAQFLVAHAAGHRLLGHGTCAVPNMDEKERMASDVGVRLLAPTDLVQAAHARATAAVARGTGSADQWEIGVIEVGGSALPPWVAVTMQVAMELNIPGWLAARRLFEERLVDVPALEDSP